MSQIKIDSDKLIKACDGWLEDHKEYKESKYVQPTASDKLDWCDLVFKVGEIKELAEYSLTITHTQDLTLLDESEFNLLKDYL